MSPFNLLLGLSLLAPATIAATSNPFLPNDDPITGYKPDPQISHNLGNYSPFYSVASSISADIPSQCTVTFAQSLQRHGARFPTKNKTILYALTVSKLQNSTKYEGKYAFLKNYRYNLGMNSLTPFGQQELVNSGKKFYERYQDLAREEDPFVRAAGSERVVMSAKNFTQGFHAAKNGDEDAEAGKYPIEILVIPEKEGVNNTLDHGLCYNFETQRPYHYIAKEKRLEWLSTFAPPITKRLNADLPGTNLVNLDTNFIMDLCAFETVASPAADLSPFCNLFTNDEFLSFEYLQDVDQWFSYGPGNPLGPTQGVGFVNELIARLTDSPVEDHTSSNRTLDENEKTFPLGRGLYADFSHDSDMTAMFAALGLDNRTVAQGGLDAKVRDSKGFKASHTVPFAARAYFEKLDCGDNEEYIRILLNDEVQPLEFCGGDELGRCTLEKFVESLSFARNGGKWDLCKGKTKDMESEVEEEVIFVQQMGDYEQVVLGGIDRE